MFTTLFYWIKFQIRRLFEAIFPQKKEQTVPKIKPALPIINTLDSVNFKDPEDVKAKLKDRNVQLAMIDWVQNTLRPLENKSVYLEAVRGTKQDKNFKVTTKRIQKILDVMTPFLLIGTPAHDLGHHIFDALGGSAIIGDDPFIAKAYRNEINAAFFSAMFHDCSTGVQHRYVDNEWELNHGEIAACIFFFNTIGMLPFNVRRLASYAIAAHPHMLKEMTTKNSSIRKPWVDELFYSGKKPVRISVWITRWTDRLENGGDPACHLPRHALAALDGARVGGLDLSGIDWFNFNDQLKYLFVPKAVVTEVPVVDREGHPVLKDGVPVINKIPSMLQHLQGYRMSADTSKPSAYNIHDDKSPNMRELMDWKVKHSIEFVDIVTNSTGIPCFNEFVMLLKLKSGNPISETGLETIKMIEDLWKLNSPEDQAHWAKGFDYAVEAYGNWLFTLTQKINKATDPTILAFKPILMELTSLVI